MKKPEESSEKGNKQVLIIETAQKRFGLFGVEKTSMREIADDLNLSKASLYYYFPDKESLYKAVVEKEQSEFIAKISERFINIKEPDQLLREFAKSRLSCFKALLNLSRLKFEAYSDLKPAFRETIRQFREKEKEIIIKIFNKGTDLGIFFIEDKEKTASLFLDLLRGLRISVVTDKITLFIEQDEFDRLLQRTIAFTDIFIKGLTVK
jgi:AcrR family transcriptional regulator